MIKILVALLAIGTTVFATLVLGAIAVAMAATGYSPLAAITILLLVFMWVDVAILIYFLKEDKWD